MSRYRVYKGYTYDHGNGAVDGDGEKIPKGPVDAMGFRLLWKGLQRFCIHKDVKALTEH